MLIMRRRCLEVSLPWGRERPASWFFDRWKWVCLAEPKTCKITPRRYRSTWGSVIPWLCVLACPSGAWNSHAFGHTQAPSSTNLPRSMLQNKSISTFKARAFLRTGETAQISQCAYRHVRKPYVVPHKPVNEPIIMTRSASC